MTKRSKTFDAVAGTTSIVVAAWVGANFATGFGYEQNGWFVQALLAGGLGTTLGFSWLSFQSALSGATYLPSKIINRYRARPFVTRLIDSAPGILSTTVPAVSAEDQLLEKRGKRKGMLKRDTGTHKNLSLLETITHEGRNIEITHRADNPMKISVSIPNQAGSQIEEALTPQEAGLLADQITRYRIQAFARVLRCNADLDTIAVNVALRLPRESVSNGTYPLENKFDGLTYISMGIRQDTTSWVMHPEIGYLHLPHDLIADTLRDQRDHLLLAAFDKSVEPLTTMPAITGNPVAAKEVSIAQKLVERYPDMTDASGTPIAPLVKEHLPRLMRVHTEATAAAMATDRIDEAHLRQIADDFEEGLAVITRAVLEGVEAEQRKSRDDLSVEIAFLKARHPEPGELAIA